MLIGGLEKNRGLGVFLSVLRPAGLCRFRSHFPALGCGHGFHTSLAPRSCPIAAMTRAISERDTLGGFGSGGKFKVALPPTGCRCPASASGSSLRSLTFGFATILPFFDLRSICRGVTGVSPVPFPKWLFAISHQKAPDPDC